MFHSEMVTAFSGARKDGGFESTELESDATMPLYERNIVNEFTGGTREGAYVQIL